MSNIETIKQQRDKFLAFCFATADLFVEVSIEGKIKSVLGAAKSLTGQDDQGLQGRSWLELFASHEQARMQNLYENSKTGARCGPVLVELNELRVAGKMGIFNCIKMPDKLEFYVTLAASSAEAAQIYKTAGTKPAALLNGDDFKRAAEEAVQKAREAGLSIDMSFFELSPLDRKMAMMGNEKWENFNDSIKTLLLSYAYDGSTAGELGSGKYSLVHDRGAAVGEIEGKIQKIAAEAMPDASEGLGLQTKTIDADSAGLNERQAAHALHHTLNEFERKGTQMQTNSLAESMDGFVASNKTKIQQFEKFLEQSSFSLFFQPVVDIKTRAADHFEILCRFDQGETRDWIIFAEDVGLAPEFDLAMFDRALQYIKFKAGGTRARFSINLTGKSIESAKFTASFFEKLEKNRNLASRLMIEISDPLKISEIEKLKKFIFKLRSEEFRVALDDLGTEARALELLKSLDVDAVKLDGRYVRRILTHPEETINVGGLQRICKNRNIMLVAEAVEEVEQAQALLDLGLEFAQGFYFAKPSPKPDYLPGKT